ncbi:DNA-binding NarL/FixJ family response regulator [Breznakibacter xylanolyticus]|uniref:DNA-binding NarL/FixJ family response regulator n=1 Tax=Breznakibacter xylanolyticus TaxID=990 RepID=A0A2W7NEI5_9BACT|nr:response regulator transcription factor [Breznakibacter xylanolyticus]MBN2743591.1 response regulator transcription factor [Marinilabiliaceae bacterium]PZX15144.1 DNA-binding NarL/FixJ family response regulator [Breznakibacter xylanolyticus]
MYSVIIVDDHKMFRESLKKMLHMEGLVKVIAEASNGKEFLNLLSSHQPDVVLMDISMPEMDGVEATRMGIELIPDLKVLTLSSFGDERYYYSMIESGVKGFVLKSSGIHELLQAIEEVSAGGSWFSNELLRKVISSIGKTPGESKRETLSEREVEILKLVCEGYSTEQIARDLSLEFDDVLMMKEGVLHKTSSANTAALVMYAIRNSLIEI